MRVLPSGTTPTCKVFKSKELTGQSNTILFLNEYINVVGHVTAPGGVIAPLSVLLKVLPVVKLYDIG